MNNSIEDKDTQKLTINKTILFDKFYDVNKNLINIVKRDLFFQDDSEDEVIKLF
jgi:hypothetical protein